MSVTVWPACFQPEPIVALLSVVEGAAESGVGVNGASALLLPAASAAWTPRAPGGVEAAVHE